jgi:Orsellinic acid/F9775 biosynthesis cluster protein D
MDLFSYHETYRVLICCPCQTVVSQTTLRTYIRNNHSTHPALQTSRAITRTTATIAITLCPGPLHNPQTEPLSCSSQPAAVITDLPVFPGYGCPYCPYVCRDKQIIAKHY